MKNVVFSMLLVFSILTPCLAQNVLHGAYQNVTSPQREKVNYTPIRQADAFYRQRIWRKIDVREKMNLPFVYPKRPLLQIIHEAASYGEIPVYDPAVDNADEFEAILSREMVQEIGRSVDTEMQIDPQTYEQIEVRIERELEWSQISSLK